MSRGFFSIDQAIEQINELNAFTFDNDEWKRLGKLTEEVGELAQAICKHRDVEQKREEAVDVALAAVAMFALLGGDGNEFSCRFANKLRKWEQCKLAVPLYSVGTWDQDEQAYTPQIGLTVPSFNITLGELRQALKELKAMGYPCHRRRAADGTYDDNDWAVLIERTDGKPETVIRKEWER